MVKFKILFLFIALLWISLTIVTKNSLIAIIFVFLVLISIKFLYHKKWEFLFERFIWKTEKELMWIFTKEEMEEIKQIYFEEEILQRVISKMWIDEMKKLVLSWFYDKEIKDFENYKNSFLDKYFSFWFCYSICLFILINI